MEVWHSGSWFTGTASGNLNFKFKLKFLRESESLAPFYT